MSHTQEDAMCVILPPPPPHAPSILIRKDYIKDFFALDFTLQWFYLM